MKKFKCTENLYRSFLEVSMLRYTGKALSEVSPKKISHDSVSRWLNKQKIRPGKLWKQAKNHLNLNSDYCLIADDTVIEKERSIKLPLAKKMYSGSKHTVVNGISTGVTRFIKVTSRSKK